jgi:hypothetical protein
MDIEHCDCLSLFSRRGESHEQDGERLPAGHPADWAVPQRSSASRDPAMAFGPSMGTDGRSFDPSPKSAAASLPDHTADALGIRDNTRETPRAISQRRIPSRSINDL